MKSGTIVCISFPANKHVTYQLFGAGRVIRNISTSVRGKLWKTWNPRGVSPEVVEGSQGSQTLSEGGPPSGGTQHPLDLFSECLPINIP
jgi:hypothetical protein